MTISRHLWTRIIEVWLFAVLFVFVIIRVLGSQTARYLLSHLGRLPHR
jgi:hypothetical protein